MTTSQDAARKPMGGRERLKRHYLSAFALACTAGALVYVAGAVAQDRPSYSNPVLLDQGWSEDDRLRYYFTPQGSAALSYDIFLHLEAAKGSELFRSNENMSGYGLIPYPAHPQYNPDGLPIGIVKTTVPDGQWRGEWIGLGCAVCHNGQIQYKGTTISISGGNSNTFDVFAFVKGLSDALTATASNPEKFDRLAARMGVRDNAGKAALRTRLSQEAAGPYDYVNRLGVTPSVVGPGRMDALLLIHNQVVSRWLGVPENWRPPLAPVKPSFAWNIPQSAWAQWSGVLPDPLMRNQGEVTGAFARMDLTSETPADGLFYSTVDLKGQIESEALLRRLAPPKWPEEILGRIDQQKASRGQQLFAENCAGCHSTWPHRWSEPRKEGKRFIENAHVMGNVIGTDPRQLASPQFDSLPTMKPGPLRDQLVPPDTGASLISQPTLFRTVIQPGIYDFAIAKLNLSEAELISAHGYGAFGSEPLPPIPAVGAYKANPAEGMWSAPPFLHNGSVPNLYELLVPAKQRTTTFFIGREFDPVKVGVDTSGASGKIPVRHDADRQFQRRTFVRGRPPCERHHWTAADRG